jgi:DNA-directed RNA polymerase specialized sigma24 family protein
VTTGEMEFKALMVAGLRGDAASYRSLLDRLSGRLRAYYKGKLARVGRGATEAEDLAQEVLLAIHLKRHTYNTGEPLTPWVHTIARYKLIDYLRRTRMAATMPLDEESEAMAHDDNASARALTTSEDFSDACRRCAISRGSPVPARHREYRRSRSRAVCGDRATRCHQPRWRAKLALELDDPRRRMA